MTEQEWLECADPTLMLEFLRGKASDRKLRLFNVACYRHIWDILINERSRQAVEIAERAADNRATDEECRAIRRLPEAQIDDAVTWTTWARQASIMGGSAAKSWLANEIAAKAERVAQCRLLREVSGNPFRPATVDPTWLTPTVVSLATAIYAERAFDRLPILADALEDAGCDNADLLNHCRQPGEHVRGCWALDLVLRKE
jgi:hypothetical protein